MKYGLSENKVSNELWLELLESKIIQADSVEFNLLFKSKVLNDEIKSLETSLIKSYKGRNKIYSGMTTYRYILTDQMIGFIKSKKYEDWMNYQFEDMSLLVEGVELLATITHENYIFLLMEKNERKYWNSKGFEFGDLFNWKE